MKHAAETEKLFQKVLDETPQEMKTQVEWQYSISDAIYNRLQELGMSKKELAQKAGTSPAAVTRWIGGGQNFTLSTLAKISAVLGVPLITVAK
ncbi:MAG: helix-turn-helix transcriptional regulator [Prevotella sp.]|nr:helix-turn-helix transcriptional regulator [Prevotella sp.]